MITIMKMLFSIVGGVLKIFWRIIKHLSKPMREGLKDIWKGSRTVYKEHNEKKAANADKTRGIDKDSESVGPDDECAHYAEGCVRES